MYLFLLKKALLAKCAISTSNWRFIWKYKTLNARKSQNNATISKSNLKNPNSRKQAHWVKMLQMNCLEGTHS